jgi:hypothetical protein
MTQRNCPYWDQVKHDCIMTRGGLYIPLPEHIEVFCKTAHFSECHHYVTGLAILAKMSNNNSVSYEDSRRRHRRIKDQLPVSFVKCDVTGRGHTDEPFEHGTTVDFSIGGMCLRSSRKVQPHELLLLQLDEKAADQSDLSGLAEVKWCNPIAESSEYLVGLAFRKTETGLAIGRQRGLTIA